MTSFRELKPALLLTSLTLCFSFFLYEIGLAKIEGIETRKFNNFQSFQISTPSPPFLTPTPETQNQGCKKPLKLEGSFTLFSGHNGIDPTREEVNIILGTTMKARALRRNIPPGSFRRIVTIGGPFVYKPPNDSLLAEVRFLSVGSGSIRFKIITKPLPVQPCNPQLLIIRVGDDGGGYSLTQKKPLKIGSLQVDTLPPVILAKDLAVSIKGKAILTSHSIIQAFLNQTRTTDNLNLTALKVSHNVTSYFLPLGPTEVTFTAVDYSANKSTATAIITVTNVSDLPTDPSTTAPSVDPHESTTSVGGSTQFLYTGDNPVQTGVSQGTIQESEASVIRGKVLDRQGNPLPGVEITILKHPEFGKTMSRVDGMFDLVVNGGEVLTVQYRRSGFLTAQRTIDVPQGDYTSLTDVYLRTLDSKVNLITLDQNAPMQIAQGSVITDKDGSRQATLMIPKGVSAEMVLPDGSVQEIKTMKLRATEYTVGSDGPKTMPAILPRNTGYTYAVEYSIDEATSAGAKTVKFSEPTYHYVENFLNFPIGEIVPAGYYDREKGEWVPAENGIVIGLRGIDDDGLMKIDLTGSGAPADQQSLEELGFQEAERKELAQLYKSGQTLWRVPITHFTPWDFNWPIVPPDDAEDPDQPDPDTDRPLSDPCEAKGSIIECQTQVLGEKLEITGTPFTLNYRSNRVPGRNAGYNLDVYVTGEFVPPKLIGVDLEISIAGQRFFEKFKAEPNQKYIFTWDGKDGYGRLLRGTQLATLKLNYRYQGRYAIPPKNRFSFNLPIRSSAGLSSPSPSVMLVSDEPRPSARSLVPLTQGHQMPVGVWDARSQRLGGWTLDVHHTYEPGAKMLHLGSGRSQQQPSLERLITRFAGTGTQGANGDGGPATEAQLWFPEGIRVGPDGHLYIVDRATSRIRRVGSDGIITTIVGTGESGFSGDGGPATEAQLNQPYDIDFGPDGSLYIVDANSQRVRRVDNDGIITTVVGNGNSGFSGDGGPAIQAEIKSPTGIAFDKEGSLYIASAANNRIRKVTPDGIISTFAGSGENGFDGDGGPATQAKLNQPKDIAIGPDGNLYIADRGNLRVRQVTQDGLMHTVAGIGPQGPMNLPGFTGDGGLAIDAEFHAINGVALDQEGNIYIADQGNHRIRRVTKDGIVNTIVGIATQGSGGDGGLSSQAELSNPNHVTIGPDNSLYIVESGQHRVRRVAAPFSGFSATDVAIPSKDGSELFQFDLTGRHLRTSSTLTGADLYSFTYDSNGLLTGIIDRDGNITQINRDANGNPNSIIGPFNQRTELATNDDGYLDTITNPAQESYVFEYSEEGLLTKETNPNGFFHTFEYGPLGRLKKDTDPEGGFTTLARTELGNGFEITKTTALGRTTTYRVDHPSSGQLRLVNTFPDGTFSETNKSKEALIQKSPDGTITELMFGPDPRFGLRVPIVSKSKITTPSGKSKSVTFSREVILASATDPLSLKNQIDRICMNGEIDSGCSGGRLAKISYNADTKERKVISPANHETSITFNGVGKLTHVQPFDLAPFSFVYDPNGRLESIDVGNETKRTTTFNYDSNGFLNFITDPLTQAIGFGFDQAGKVNKINLQNSSEVLLNYDRNGNLIELIAPKKSVHTFDYTRNDLVDVYTPPLIGIDPSSIDFDYNLDSKLTVVRKPDGQTVVISYDNGGRPSNLTIASGTTIYKYDPLNGRQVSIDTPMVGLKYTYDGSFIKKVAWTGAIKGDVGWTYDQQFDVDIQTVNEGYDVDYDYDSDGLIIKAGLLNLIRNIHNRLLIGTELDKLTTVQEYNDFGELSSFKATYKDGTVTKTLYEVGIPNRDLLGRIKESVQTIDGVSVTTSYNYYPRGWLSDVFENGIHVAHFDYDLNGNRLNYENPQTSKRIFGEYDSQDRLVRYGDFTYDYTSTGEIQSKSYVDNGSAKTTTYQYDDFWNLLKLELPDGRKIEYVVDGQNRRVGKKVNGLLTQGFLYQDQLNPVAELDGKGNVVSRFVYATRPNVPDYMIRGDKLYRVLSNHLGSVQLVVDVASGNIKQRVKYDDFGNILLDTNPGFQPFGYAGGIYDPDTGLSRIGVRDYDPLIGRWLSKDPQLFDGDGENLYLYSLGDPINNLDSSGKKTSVITTYDHGVGTHSALYIDSDGDAIIYDPGGSYMAGKGRGSDAVISGEDANLYNYIMYHYRAGSDVLVQPFSTTPDEEKEIAANIDYIGDLGGGFCGVAVCEALSGIGPFKDLNFYFFPGSLADALREIREQLKPCP